jgi:polyisoprenoid-binding protein YceI
MRPPFRRETCLRLLIVALIPSFPGSAHTQPTRPPVTATLRSGTLSFSAHATAGDFVGTTATVSGVVSGSVANPQGWVEAPVMTLTTHNDRRDRDMRASLEAPTYPTIRFTLTGATVTSGDGQGNPVSATLHGTLAIHGVTRDVSPPATIVLRGDTILVVASFPLDVRDYKVGGLTKLLGILRMDPMIGVRADLRFVANQARTTDAGRGELPRTTAVVGTRLIVRRAAVRDHRTPAGAGAAKVGASTRPAVTCAIM